MRSPKDSQSRNTPRYHRREGQRLSKAVAIELGAKVRAARRRRRLTQKALADRIGVHQSRISQIERGEGESLPLAIWFALASALDMPLRVEFGRDPAEQPADAGHLAIQELVLRLGRRAGYHGTFELATRPAEPTRSTDVALRNDRSRCLVLVECWNTIGDIGAAARSASRKIAEAEQLAIALGGERPYTVGGCWVVRATKRNRELVARYPEVFASRLPGSSRGWLEALSVGTPPPAVPGLVWADVGGHRLFEWRRRGVVG